jgi:TonB dependent receptor
MAVGVTSIEQKFSSVWLGIMVLAAPQWAHASTEVIEQEVVVTAARHADANTEPSQQTRQLLDVPGSLGDPLQAVYSLPGVVQTSDDGGQPAVRGSGPQDNAYLIDSLPASFVFHDFGNSIFEESLIQDFGLLTAGYGPRYGKATGAVFDIRLRQPRTQPLKYTLEASALRATAMVEGGLSDNQAFYVSYRESLYHLILPYVEQDQQKNDDTKFVQYPRSRDFQAKYVWNINAQQRLSLLTLGAQDKTALNYGKNSDVALLDPGSTGTSSIDTRFASQAISWRYDDGITQLNSALGYLRESRRDRVANGKEYADIDTDEWSLKSSYERALGTRQTGVAGVELYDQVFHYRVNARYRSCSAFSPECATDPGELVQARDQQTMRSQAVFAQDTLTLFNKLSVTAGWRYSHNQYLQETHLEPRASFTLPLTSPWELHGSWGRYHQLPEIVQMIPVFGNPQLRSLRATHYVTGVSYAAGQRITWNADVYYKQLRKLVVDVSDGSQYQNQAHGTAYGAELMVRRNLLHPQDRFYGWFTLSLSRTQRENDLRNQTIRFDYDTPLVVNLVGNYRFGPQWSAGMRWNFRSGYPYTPITGNVENPDFPGYYVPVYGPLNSARAAAYHRLDLRVERQFGHGRFKGSYFFDLINAYARNNGGAVVYKPIPGTRDYRLETTDSLPLIPAAGIRINFQ